MIFIQYVNRDPKDQTNPFLTMIIRIQGKAVAKNRRQRSRSPDDEPTEIILLMFGGGA